MWPEELPYCAYKNINKLSKRDCLRGAWTSFYMETRDFRFQVGSLLFYLRCEPLILTKSNYCCVCCFVWWTLLFKRLCWHQAIKISASLTPRWVGQRVASLHINMQMARWKNSVDLDLVSATAPSVIFRLFQATHAAKLVTTKLPSLSTKKKKCS